MSRADALHATLLLKGSAGAWLAQAARFQQGS